MMIQTRKQLVNQRGFSMVEVLVTMSVMAIGLLSVARFNDTLTQDSNLVRSRTEAVNLVQDKIEQMRNYRTLADYNNLVTGQDTLGPASLIPDITVPGLHNLYTRTWTVTPDSTNPTHAKVLNVTVTWPNLKGQVTPNSTITLVTVIAKNNPSTSALAMKNL